MRGSLFLALVILGACRSTEAPAPEAAAPDSALLSNARPEGPDGRAAVPDAPAPTETPTEAVSTQWWRDAIGYEIFVRSFQDTNGDGIGDLKGITGRLDHLTSLGVDLVWLMPIHPSPSYHGYDVVDYRDVNPEYGTLADLDALIAAAKERGIRIIIDLLLNHSSDRNPWFLESRKGPDSPKRDWYLWRKEAPEGWYRPWDGASLWHQLGDQYYYGLFWSGMPDLNMESPAVQAEMEDIMAFWVKRGLAGFRVDAIRYLIETPHEGGAQTADSPATHAYLKGLRKRVDERLPGTLLLGEAWSSVEDQAGYYGDGDELHLAFSFDMAAAIVETSRDGVRSRLNQMLDRSAEVIKDRGFEAPFLTNHDMARVAREMKHPAQLRVAAALMLASPGTPFIYYGEEIGMIGGAARDDQNKRTPMHWTAGPNKGFTTGEPWWPMTDEADGIDVGTQAADPGSLLSLYRKLSATRKQHTALRRGDQQRIAVKGGKGVVAFLRTAGTERVLVVANVDDQSVPAFAVPVAGKPRVILAEGMSSAPTSDGPNLSVELGPRAFAWIALD